MSDINKVEILRAICFSMENMEQIKDIGLSFSDVEIETMIEFKRIYELGVGEDGLTGLKRFINKLLYEGKDELSEYTINYYVNQLLNGPFREYTKSLTGGKYFFTSISDNMGCVGNAERTDVNVSMVSSDDYPLGVSSSIYFKLPSIMKETLLSAINITNDIFRATTKSIWTHDNTLPLVDKKPQERCDSEPKGGYDLKPIANYGIKDVSDYILVAKPISPVIFANVKNTVGGEPDYNKRFLYSKLDNPFENNSTSENYKVTRIVTDENINTSQEIVTDITGDEFDSDSKRSVKLKLVNNEVDKEYILNTNEGQLGN